MNEANMTTLEWEVESLPSEEDVKCLVLSVRSFRQKWAEFAVASNPVFEKFRSHGASFPESFLDSVAELDDEKKQLFTEIVERTAGIPEQQWQPPTLESSLHEIELSLDELMRLARAQSEKQVRQQQSAIQVLREIKLVNCVDREYQQGLNRLLQQVDLEIETLELQRSCISVSTKQFLIPSLSFLKLVVDAARDRQTGLDSVKPLTLEACDDCFDSVADYFGRDVAMAALRARYVPRDSRFEQLTAIVNEQGSAATGITVQQMAQLERKFSISVAPAPERRMPSSASEAPKPPEFERFPEEDLKRIIRNLRQKASQYTPSTQQTDGANVVRHHVLTNLAEIFELTVEMVLSGENVLIEYREESHTALRLLAEAQNAARVHQESVNPDGVALPEQNDAFRWLRYLTSEEVGAFPIDRFMKRSDSANPADHPELAARIADFRRTWTRISRPKRALLNIQKAVEDLSQSSLNEGWKRVDAFIVQFIKAGGKTSDAELRELLVGHVELLPGSAEENGGDFLGLSPESRKVFESISDYLESRSHREADEKPPGENISPEVKQVRDLVSGRTIAIVGGEVRPDASNRIEEAFGLRELIWVPASKKDRVSDLQPKIRNADVVVLITGLIGHKHNHVRTICSKLGIPWVQTRYRAGYGVNQLASVILEQASDQLRR